MRSYGYFSRKGRALGGFYKDLAKPGIEATREIDEAFKDSKGWQRWKKAATLFSLLVIIVFWGIGIQEQYQRYGNIPFDFKTVAEGLSLSLVVFFIMRYLIIYAMVWIPFVLVILGMDWLLR